MNDRIIKLIGKSAFFKLQSVNILLIGLGGVGGYVLESLVRSGISSFTILDADSFEESNLNRQIFATTETLGMSKVLAASKRALSINPNVKIHTIHKKIGKIDITEEFLKSFTFVIDACDTVEVKLELIRQCTHLSIPIVSSMGSANRIHAESVQIMPLKKTINDPLAKVIRHELRYDSKCLNSIVVCSTEIPVKQKELGTICPVPMAFGAVISSYVIHSILYH